MSIYIVGEARGENEDKLNSCFVGSSGVELIRMLSESGILSLTSYDKDYIFKYYKTSDPKCIMAIWDLHPEIRRTNVFQIRPPRNDIEWFTGPKAEGIPGYPALVKTKHVRREFQSELTRLGDELIAFDPNLILCLGNTALWALGGRVGIMKYRGTTLMSTHTVEGFKLLPTYHPSAVLRQWELRPTVISDLMKANTEKDYGDIRRPIREIWIEPTIEDIKTFFADHVDSSCLLSVDIETSGSRITCIGFAPNSGLAIVIPFDDTRRPDGNYWPTKADEIAVWRIIRSVLANRAIKKLFQNGVYDIAFLWRAYGIAVYGAEHDTMLLQHALQPEAKKGLGYLGSIYSDEASWKHMRKKTETIKRDN